MREDSGGERLISLCLGLAGHAEGLAAEARRLRASGSWQWDIVASELGEVAYHWASLCRALGLEPHHLLEVSVTGVVKRGRGAAAQPEGPQPGA